MLNKLPLILKVVVLFSFIFLASGALLETINPSARGVKQISASQAVIATSETAPNTPRLLIIPRLGIKLPIIPGVYDPSTKTWTLTESNVQYAGMTALPNDRSGNTLLYGHNTSAVLAPTDRLVEGDTAQVITQDGLTFTYIFTGGSLVDPTDTSVLGAEDSPPRLTLLTCDGLWDEKRRLMEFDFISVE